MKGNGGAAHVEMIVSFTLFFLFVLFIMMILKPYDTSTTLSGSVVSGLNERIDRNATTELSKALVKANLKNKEVGAVDRACFKIELSDGTFAYGFVDRDSLVKEIVAGNPAEINSSLDAKFLSVNESVLIGSEESKFYDFYVSKDFEDDLVPVDCLAVSDFELGGIVERKVISFKALSAMKKRYDTDYEGLKKDLGIPASYDFAIVVEDLTQLTMQGIVPDSGEVMARDYLKEVLMPDGTVKNVRVTLKLW